jgi:phosphate uptake regulator
MKKISLLLLATVFTLSIYSCRETTEEKTEDAVEEIGNDVQEATEESVEAVEDATEESVEAVEGTEDVDADQE